MAESEFTPKAGLSASTNAKLAKMHARCMQISRRKNVNAKRFLASLQDLTQIMQTVVQMSQQQELKHG
jgi:hypothetical protein